MHNLCKRRKQQNRSLHYSVHASLFCKKKRSRRTVNRDAEVVFRCFYLREMTWIFCGTVKGRPIISFKLVRHEPSVGLFRVLKVACLLSQFNNAKKYEQFSQFIKLIKLINLIIWQKTACRLSCENCAESCHSILPTVAHFNSVRNR